MIIGPIIRGPGRRQITGGKHLLISSGNNAHNFWKGRSRDFSFTRASTKTFTDAAGVLQTAAIDEIVYTNSLTVGDDSSGWSFEGTVTNELPRSEELDNAAWTKFGSTITANDTTAPDSAMTMDSIDEDGLDSEHGISQAVTTVLNINTLTCFAKPINQDFLYMELVTNGFGTQFAYFDLVNGVMTSATPGFVTEIRGPYADGSYRCFLYGLETLAGAGTVRILAADADGSNSYLGTTQQSVHVWGCQFEQGWPSSYIPTVAAGVTRSPDQPVTDMRTLYRINQPFTYNTSTRIEADISLINEVIIWSEWVDPVNSEFLSHNKSGVTSAGTSVSDSAAGLVTITRNVTGSLISHIIETATRWHQGRHTIDVKVEHVSVFNQSDGGAGTQVWVDAPQNLRFFNDAVTQMSTRWAGVEMSQS